MQLWLAIFFLVVLDSAGSLAMAGAMKRVPQFEGWHVQGILQMVGHAVGQPLLWVGTCCQAGTFFLLLWLLSWADLSVVVPLASVSYGVSALGARFILQETITRERWLGTLMICLGVALISLHTRPTP